MADIIKKVRKSNFSPEEVDALVSTVKRHYKILYGQYSKRAVNKLARHKSWLDVLRRVNQVSVEKRTLQEVKNKWKKCQHYYKLHDRAYFEQFDSMPLEQRLSESQSPDGEQSQFLHSQPLSPTKLKVTRHSTTPILPKPPPLQAKPPSPEPANEEVCLRWNSHHSNMQTAFPTLLLREQYVDVTLVAEGRTLKCHRLILSSCSPYFEEVLNGISPLQHPVLFMKDVPFFILKSLCDFMYAGEVHIYQNKLQELLSVAEALKIKGLAGKSTTEEPKGDKPNENHHHTPKPVAPLNNSNNSVPSSSSGRKFESSDGDDVLDPLDLLEPVYEEKLTKDTPPCTSTPKPKDNKYSPMKKPFAKKVKKRRYSDEREDSPPSFFQSRKGTRSRPNVKIPKYYHSDYASGTKTPSENSTTIEREPHRNLDVLIAADDIKSEPLDMDEEALDFQDNFMQDDEMISARYDSPIVNQKPFKKINLVAQPVITEVRSVQPKKPTSGAKLQIIDMSKTDGKILKKIQEDIVDTGLEIIDTTNNKLVSDPTIITGFQIAKENTVDEDEEDGSGEEEDDINGEAEDDEGRVEDVMDAVETQMSDEEDEHEEPVEEKQPEEVDEKQPEEVDEKQPEELDENQPEEAEESTQMDEENELEDPEEPDDQHTVMDNMTDNNVNDDITATDNS